MSAADSELIRHLNGLLKSKLTGINQYFLHARMLKHQGEVKLADYEYKASLVAMKHADMIVEHILSQGGRPNLQELGALAIGEDRASMLRGDLALAESVQVQLRAAITLCDSRKDTTTTALLGRILESQQEHIEAVRTHLQPTSEKIKDCA